MFTCDFSERSGKPKYLFLYERLKQAMLGQQLPEGEKLPSKRKLAADLGIGINTVNTAYSMLQTEGYISSKQRSGFYVESLGVQPPITTTKPLRPKRAPLTEDAPRTPVVDFKANRTSLELFPKTVWNQLMRKTLLEGDKLYETVPFNGLFELRAAIANHLVQSRGMFVDPDQIIIGAGTEYLYLRLVQLLGKSAVFGFEDPGYKKLATIPQSLGNISRFIDLDDDGIRVDALSESDVDIVHVSPANHFPTGIAMPVSRRGQLLEWASRASKRFIIEDDYDSEFRFRGKYIEPLYAQDVQEKVIYMNTFSKTLVPSLRISYMLLPQKLMQRYIESMSFYSCTVSSFEQATLAKYIAEGHYERHINRLRNYYRKLRLQVIQEFRKSPLAKRSRLVENNAGTHFLLYVETDMGIAEIKERALKGNTVLHFLQDYVSEANVERLQGVVCLVINYGAIRPDDVESSVARLSQLFS